MFAATGTTSCSSRDAGTDSTRWLRTSPTRRARGRLAEPDGPAAPSASGRSPKRGIAVEFLVNNAGFGTTGAFVELDPARELGMVQVNVTALVHLTRLLLPPMVARGSGRVLNLGSTAGFLPGPFMAVYYASKAFVNSFTEALSYELQGTGVTATVCCPGATATEFGQVAGNDKSRLFQMGAMTATSVGAHAYREMMRGGVVSIPGWRNKVSLQSLRIAPRIFCGGWRQIEPDPGSASVDDVGQLAAALIDPSL